jgi:type IV secretory pathway VirB10-like protein
VSSPAPSPLSPPPAPAATRLNRRALAVAAALAVALALIVAFSIQKKEKAPALPTEVAEFQPSEPSFLRREPRSVPTPEQYFDDLAERQQAALDELQDPDLGPLPPQPSLPPPAPAVVVDPAREAFARALRAPIRPDAVRQQAGAGPASLPGFPQPPTDFPRLPSVGDFSRIPGLAAPAPEPEPEPDRFARFRNSPAPPTGVAYQILPSAPYRLQAGTVLPAALLSAIDSNLPGDILGVVTHDVYDSVDQRHLLIPRGSRLVGRYDHQIAVGQDRLLVGWERLFLPDGTSLTLPGLPAVDPAGRAGLSGRVDNHLWRVFGNALLLSVVSAGAQLSQPQESAQFGQAASPRQVASAALGQELSAVAIEILRRAANVTPTIRVPAGTTFSVFLAGDLTFAQPYSERAR